MNADDIPRVVLGDCARFRQIFANLLSNSIKYTASGWIWIRGWAMERGGGGEGEGQVAIYFEVEDTGMGENANWDWGPRFRV